MLTTSLYISVKDTIGHLKIFRDLAETKKYAFLAKEEM